MKKESLKTKAAKGMAWSSMGTFASRGIGFVIGIILARILTPSDYGLIGMLAIFFAISQIFIDGGLSKALIQKIDRDETDYSTIFYYNLLVSIFLYVILFFSAPFIADFYDTPELSLLTRILSLNIIIGSLSVVQKARLKILMNFKTEAIIIIISVVISGVLGITLAYLNFGVWALVVQSLTATVVTTILEFILNNWYPKLVFSRSSFQKLFGFSSKLLVAGLIAATFNNIYAILIGKLFAPKEVGFYTRGKQFPELIANTMSAILQGVTFPILTSLQNERERMVQVYGKLMRTTVFVVIPVLTLFALLAEPFVRLFLTEKWMPIVPLIQWLCFARMITPISALNMNILNAIGRSDLFLKVDLVKIPMAILALIITVPLGLIAVVIGNFITTLISFFINTYYPGKIFGYGAKKQIIEMKSIVISSIIMVACVLFVNYFLQEDFIKLIAGTIIGILSYLGTAHLMKVEETAEIKKAVLKIVGYKKISI